MSRIWNRVSPVALSAVLFVMQAVAPGAATAQESPAPLQDFKLDPAKDPGRPQAAQPQGPESNGQPTQAPTPQAAPTLPAAQIDTQPLAPAIAPPHVTLTLPPAPAPGKKARHAARPAPATIEGATRSPAGPPVQTKALPAQPQSASPLAEPAISNPPGSPSAQPTPSTPRNETSPEAPSASAPWLWAAGAALVALAALGLVWRRKRRTSREADQEQPVFTEAVQARAAPTPAPPAPPPPVIRPRPWLTLDFHPESARSTLVGATIAYRLTIRNSGTANARDIGFAAHITSASVQEQRALSALFAAPMADGAHPIAMLPPGGEVTIRGELRLDHDAIAPVKLQDRLLFIPLVAIDIRYGWGESERGQTAIAYIVGQENDPPAEKMAPFRLDLGPRQYRAIGSRQAEGALLA